MNDQNLIDCFAGSFIQSCICLCLEKDVNAQLILRGFEFNHVVAAKYFGNIVVDLLVHQLFDDQQVENKKQEELHQFFAEKAKHLQNEIDFEVEKIGGEKMLVSREDLMAHYIRLKLVVFTRR